MMVQQRVIGGGSSLSHVISRLPNPNYFSFFFLYTTGVPRGGGGGTPALLVTPHASSSEGVLDRLYQGMTLVGGGGASDRIQ